MDGNTNIAPSSSAHLGATNIDYQMSYAAFGLNPEVSWYQVRGNHDRFWAGTSASPEYGFWEVENPSMKDSPQQFRTFEIRSNADNTISIKTTDIVNNAELLKVLTPTMQSVIAESGEPMGYQIAMDIDSTHATTHFLGELRHTTNLLSTWTTATNISACTVSTTTPLDFLPCNRVTSRKGRTQPAWPYSMNAKSLNDLVDIPRRTLFQEIAEAYHMKIIIISALEIKT